METWLPSHDRYMMTMADAVQVNGLPASHASHPSTFPRF